MAVQKTAGIKHRIDQTVMGDHCAKWRITGAEPLGDGDDVRLHTKMFGSHELAGAPATRHHLIMDQQDAVAITDFANRLHVTGRRHQRAGRRSADRFDDKGQNAVRAFLQNFGLEHRCVMDARRRVIDVQPIKISPWRGYFRHRLHHRQERI